MRRGLRGRTAAAGRAYLLGMAVALSACSWWLAGRGGARVRDQILMSHAGHQDVGAECGDCHGGVAAAESLAGSFLPREAACLECHDRSDCQKCHTDIDARVGDASYANPDEAPAATAPPPELHFSHKAHLERVAGDCKRCHESTVVATAIPVPPMKMEVCAGCHEHALQIADARCDVCHASLQTLPLPAIGALRHAGEFVSRHGMLARTAGVKCLQCHTEASCSDCHSQVAPAVNARLFPDASDRTLLHRNDFATTHGIEARADADLCVRCHGADTGRFCGGCHEAVGLTPTATAGRNPHPAGYAIPGGSQFHGDDARRQPLSCAACHDQGAASVCVDCHRAGGIGGSPHPPGFAARHPRSEIDVNGMCRYCH